jgi:hypothetical protein
MAKVNMKYTEIRNSRAASYENNSKIIRRYKTFLEQLVITQVINIFHAITGTEA